MRGDQQPTYSWCDSWNRSEGRFACAMADAYGLPPHPWQRTVLNDWLALDDDGRLMNRLCAVPVPRQNGKTGICDPRETWGLVHRGEWILHTAQEYQTAKKAFDRLRFKFGACKDDPRAAYPELNRLVDRYTTSANQMVLDLTNGAHIEFRTRGSNSDMGRGGTFDLVVIDEAQSYTDEQDAALSPLNSAAPHGSPQTILMGTVPDPRKPYKGETFTRIRESLHRDPYRGACIHEWAADEIGDPHDRERWYRCNPSLGFQLLESAIEKDARTMSADAFAREHLGWWPENVRSAHPISAADWKACANENPERGGLSVLAVKFSPDGAVGTLAECVRPDGGKPFVYVVDNRSMAGGLGWFAQRLLEKSSATALFVIDGQSNAQALTDRLVEGGMPVRAICRPKASDVIAACSGFANAVKEGLVEHYPQPALDASATKSTKRSIGASGGWGFQSTDEADSTLVEACALAWQGAMTTKRDPNRKAVVF